MTMSIKAFLILEIVLWAQFVLDMQFVIQVAINGRFSSRHMRQVVNDVTARAVTAFAATGGDPHRSVLIVGSILSFWLVHLYSKFITTG
jgi:hypothetical protein